MMANIQRILLTGFLFLLSVASSAQISILSWNVENLGASKSRAELGFIAEIVSGADLIALQEVVSGPAGPEAVGRLVAEMNRHGDVWGYMVSAATTGSAHSKERYAFIWKKNMIRKFANGWLEKSLADVVDREPYCATFVYKGKKITLVSFHATTKKNKPESEIRYFKNMPARYPDSNLVFVGDFNLPQSHTVFNPLRKLGFLPAFKGQKTSLRQKCIGGDCLASEYDNVWYSAAKFRKRSIEAIHFYKAFDDIKEARMISDHIPLLVRLEFP